VETLRRKSSTKGFAISQAFAQSDFKRGRTKTKLGNLAGTLESVNFRNKSVLGILGAMWDKTGLRYAFCLVILSLRNVTEI